MIISNAPKGRNSTMSSPQQPDLTLRDPLVALDAAFTDSTSVIDAAIQLLVDEGHVTPEYIEDVRNRERKTTSYIGNHVAIPHGLDPTRSHVITSAISFIQVPRGVPFGEETAYLVIGIAGKGDEHLPMLAQLAETLVDEDKVDALRRATDLFSINSILAGGKEL